MAVDGRPERTFTRVCSLSAISCASCSRSWVRNWARKLASGSVFQRSSARLRVSLRVVYSENPSGEWAFLVRHTPLVKRVTSSSLLLVPHVMLDQLAAGIPTIFMSQEILILTAQL